MARIMPRKTREGSEAAARWDAFKRYLQDKWKEVLENSKPADRAPPEAATV